MKYTVHQINLSDDQFNAHRETYLNTTSLGEVFNIGNIGPQSKIKRLAPMHSVSVGDVIVDAKGHAVYVSTFGFKPMGFNLFSS